MLVILNDALQERRLDSQYVAMLFAVWDDANQTLQLANAGAVQPLFCRAGEVTTVRAEGIPLGMFPDVEYEEFSLSTQPGDSIIFFSDGIVDAQNAGKEMFGNERLVAIVQANQHKSVGQVLRMPSSAACLNFKAASITSTTKPWSCFAFFNPERCEPAIR